ncbi:hypothetical protein M0812_04606 [Anaeramoeba flamelloides]|uniref:Uncharacterized protein n=1 Tax=Anaeramoeba flamelloides TaxID=1746091 RepID=A0AAV8AKE8_9EUKA|nr:hypothetical protein M0812_04606 [Anaeramoeba flamelloides]
MSKTKKTQFQQKLPTIGILERTLPAFVNGFVGDIFFVYENIKTKSNFVNKICFLIENIILFFLKIYSIPIKISDQILCFLYDRLFHPLFKFTTKIILIPFLKIQPYLPNLNKIYEDATNLKRKKKESIGAIPSFDWIAEKSLLVLESLFPEIKDIRNGGYHYTGYNYGLSKIFPQWINKPLRFILVITFVAIPTELSVQCSKSGVCVEISKNISALGNWSIEFFRACFTFRGADVWRSLQEGCSSLETTIRQWTETIKEHDNSQIKN